MLSYLKVENFAVVEKVEIDFSDGLNVFTGETGAGKSILIDAISLFLKKRIPGNAVRNGTDRLVVEAMFTRGEEEFVLRRELSKKKSLSYVDGGMVPFERLKEKAVGLLNIYGQNEHVFLLHTANHGLFLDQFSGNGEILNRLAVVYAQLKGALKELNLLHEKNREVQEKLDFIDFQVSEIDSLQMEKGDDEKLEHRLKVLSSAEEILSRSEQLIDALYQGENAVYNTVAGGIKNIEYLKGIYPELSSYNDEINRFYSLLPELSALLSAISGKVEYNEEELNEVGEKISKLNRLKTKYRLNLDQLLEKRETLEGDRDSLANLGFSITDKQREIDEILRQYRELNEILRDKRRQKSAELRAAVERELSLLEMDKAKFLVEIETVTPDLTNISERGTDRVEFLFTSNPGQEAARIKEVISGGELSRLMLVLKSISDENRFSTYIFDEIDTGIGGKTAEFVGGKLKKIAASNQVICISHLPQIASFADRHFLINKEFTDNQTFSSTRELTDGERVTEIARLMAGSAVNEDVIRAAKNLLNKRKGG